MRDRVLVWALRSATAVAAGALLVIVAFIVWEARLALTEIGPVALATDGAWFPSHGRYGLWPMALGSVLVAGGAVALAAPLGVGAAIFCHFYAPPTVARVFRRMVELLGGIPSVVYGFWGLTTIVPWIARLAPPGASLLAGALVLAVMILPLLALAVDAALATVPRAVLQSGYALGLSRLTIARRLAIPHARGAIRAGLLLQSGRALGETMAVLMVCGNVVQVPGSIFDPVRTLTAHMALEMAYAMDAHRSALFASGLVLCGAVALVVALARAGGGPHAR